MTTDEEQLNIMPNEPHLSIPRRMALEELLHEHVRDAEIKIVIKALRSELLRRQQRRAAGRLQSAIRNPKS